jgi:hypothetical protein
VIHTFHGIELVGFLLTHEKDFPNITPTKQLDLLEARWTNLNLVVKRMRNMPSQTEKLKLTDLTLIELLE